MLDVFRIRKKGEEASCCGIDKGRYDFRYFGAAASL